MAVNIIIPIHNTSPELFARALASLATQTKRGFITTVIDDASSQENSNQYQEAISTCSFEIIYRRVDENVGPGAARQLGMDMAWPPIDYFMFLDADDVLMPTAVDILYNEAKINDSDIVVSNILAEGEHRSKNFTIPYGHNTTWTHGKIYKRKFLEENNIRFPEQKMFNEDSYFNLVAVLSTTKKFYITETLYLWSYNKNSITRRNGMDSFLKEYGIDYLRSQVMAALFILEKGNKNLGLTMASIYNASQNEVLLNPNNKEIVHDLLLNLFKNTYVKEQFLNEESLNEFLNKAAAGQDGKLYRQSAYDWVNQYLEETKYESGQAKDNYVFWQG